MKFRVSRNDLKRFNRPIISIPYCSAQFLLNYESPQGYNYGIYGWNYDVYVFDNVIITTGYRPIGKLAANYRTYESEAWKAYHTIDSYDECKKAISELLVHFLNEQTEKKEG